MPRPLAACLTAEFLGTFILVFFGCGAVHSAVLTGSLTGLWQVGIVWGIAIMLAIYSVGAISGAHINPAITIALAVWKQFPMGRVIPYCMAQLGGAILGAAVLYSLFGAYLQEIETTKKVVRGQRGSEITAMCYGEYFPNPGSLAGGDAPYDATIHDQLNVKVSELTACWAELLGTLLLAFVVAAVTDERNSLGPQRLAPVFIGLTVTALICVLAPLTQACFNPARDFGPRLFAYFAGWGTIAIPGPRGMGFLTVYVISPIIGAVLGIGLFRNVVRPAMIADAPDSKGEQR